MSLCLLKAIYTAILYRCIFIGKNNNKNNPLSTHNFNVIRKSHEAVSIQLGMIRKEGRKENVLFNDALNTFYLRLYGVR